MALKTPRLMQSILKKYDVASWTDSIRQAVKTFEPSPPRERSPIPGFVDAAVEAPLYPEHPIHGIAASRGEGEAIHLGTGVRVKDHVDENVWVAEEDDVEDRLDEEDEEVVELVMDNEDMLEMLMVEQEDVSVILGEDKQDEEDDEEVEEEQDELPPLKWEEERNDVDEEEELEEDIEEQESGLVVQDEQNDSIKKQCERDHSPVQIEVTRDSAKGTGDAKCDEEGVLIIGRGKGDVDVVGEDVPECKADTQDRDGEKLLGRGGRTVEASFASGAPSMTISAQENLLQKHGDIETISPPQVG